MISLGLFLAIATCILSTLRMKKCICKDMTGDAYNYVLSYIVINKTSNVIDLIQHPIDYSPFNLSSIQTNRQESYFLDLTLAWPKVVKRI